MEPKKYSRKEAKKLMKEYKLKWTWDSTLVKEIFNEESNYNYNSIIILNFSI